MLIQIIDRWYNIGEYRKVRKIIRRISITVHVRERRTCNERELSFYRTNIILAMNEKNIDKKKLPLPPDASVIARSPYIQTSGKLEV